MIQARQISYRYPQNNHGLPPISLTIAPGELMLVTGTSGSGKSTLARCLMGLIPHLYHGDLAGQVHLNGLNTRQTPLWQLAQHAGMVFQNPAAQMLAPTVEDEIIFGLENLGLPPAEIRARLEAYLTLFGLTPLRARSPLTLSGGEQQKLALAAVVARQPQALILDEPLSMLDTTSAADLIENIASLADQGTAVAIFEHRQEYLGAVPKLRTLGLNGQPKSNLIPPPKLNLTPIESFSLEISALTVQFGPHRPLNELDLSLQSGQVVAIVGRNGVGKTSLLRAIVGLQKHTGIVRISCADGTSENPDLGLVFQNPDLQLFNGSGRAEMLYRLDDPDLAYYESLMQALGLKLYEHTPPLLLSEGEKKRLTLGMILMRKPRHGVLLDEPSLGQDSCHKAILTGLLRALADAGQLVVLTTHDLPLAAKADRLILLGPEGILAAGSPKQVFRDTAVWRRAGILLPSWLQKEISTRSELH